MSINNNSLHKLPLKSTVNLNRFENEVNDWKQYVKLNSPVYGGVLSTFYKQSIILNSGEKFIMYDKNSRMWTKKYNSDTTNTDVYCDGKFIKSFTNETAEKIYLQRDFGIIAGNEDFPIYSSDYPGEEVSSEFVYSSDMSYGLLIVMSWISTSLERTVEIFDISSGEKELKKTFSFTLDSETTVSTFFTSSAITVSNNVALLHLSILPYGNVAWTEFFRNESYKCFDMSTYNEVTLSFSGNKPSIPIPFKDYAEKRDLWDGLYLLAKFPYGSILGTETTKYTKNNEEVELTSDEYDELLSGMTEDTTAYGIDSPVFHIENSIVFDDKLYLFPYSSEGITNKFGLDVFEGQYIYYAELSSFTSATISMGVVDNSSSLTQYTLSSFDNILSSPSTKHLEFYDKEDNKIDGIKVQYCYINSTPSESYYVTDKEADGVLMLELKKLDITFNFFNSFNMEIKNVYSPFFRGALWGTKSPTQATKETGLNNVLSDDIKIYLRLDIPSNYNFLAEDIRGFSTFDIYSASYTTTVNDTDILDGNIYYQNNLGSGYKLTDVTDKCVFYSSQINTEEEYSRTVTLKIYNSTTESWNTYSAVVTKKIGVYGVVGFPLNYKINKGLLGYTFTNGQPFAITRGISNLENQISMFMSVDNTNNIIYYKDNNGDYCCIKALNASYTVAHQVVDKFIIMNSANYTDSDKTNVINTEDISFFPSSLDWNSRNSLLFGKGCGLEFEDNIVCGYYATTRLMSTTRISSAYGFEENVQSILFVSSVNEQFLASSNGIGDNWCSSLVGVQALKSIPSCYIDDNVMSNDGFFGFNNDEVTYITNDKNDYDTFFINNYLSNAMTEEDLEDNADYPTSCLYRFSMPTTNPDLEDLIGDISYPFESNVLLNICLFDVITSSYYTSWFVKVNDNVYNLEINGTTQEPVFAYEMLTQGTFLGAFVIKGSIYGYTDKYIFPLSYSDGVITQGSAIINIKGMKFIEATPYQAYFYSESNRSVYSFSGDNTITKMFESNRITSITKTFYNTSTQDIWCLTNDGILCIQVDNSIFKLEKTSFVDIGSIDEYVFIVSEDLESLELLSYNYDETFEKVPIELETEFYGVDDFTTSINDTVYIRLCTDEDYEDFIGDVELTCEALTQLSKTSETKKFHIEKSDWDKETYTLLLRYQPKYQEAIGFRVKVKSDFNISAIYINSTPIATTNSKHNV